MGNSANDGKSTKRHDIVPMECIVMNTGKATRTFCAIDFEGDVGNLGLIGMSWFCTQENGYTTDREEMVDVLEHLAQAGYTFVCHNAEYDITVGFWQLNLDVTIVFRNNSFNHGRWINSHTKKITQIWCSWKLSNGLSLHDLGGSLSMPKLPTPQRLLGIDPDKYEWQCDTHDRWECETCYAIRDAQIVWHYMNDFTLFLETRLCKPKRTLGSTSIALWRAISNPDSIQLSSLEQDAIARAAYYGGRVECFKVGALSSLYTADVQSMYPSVMYNTPMPLTRSLSMRSYDGIDPIILQNEGVSECTVTVPTCHVPPLPLKMLDRLHFAIGTFRGSWTHLELRNAINHGVTIECIHSSLFASQNCYPFCDYIDYLREARLAYKECDDSRQIVCKILLNALYGRLGLSPQQLEEHVRMLGKDVSVSSLYGVELDVIDGRVIIRQTVTRGKPSHESLMQNGAPIADEPSSDYQLSRYANVLWAAQITSAARVKLHNLLVMQGEHIAYCDTDSVFSTMPIIGTSEGFGNLTDEQQYMGGYIAAPKMYWLDTLDGQRNARAKGVQRALAEEYIRGSVVQSNQPVRPRASRTLHILPGTWLPTFKQRHYMLSKRHILTPDRITFENGYSDTEPLSMSMSSTASDDALDESV